jgi:hypothetical protein
MKAGDANAGADLAALLKMGLRTSACTAISITFC